MTDKDNRILTPGEYDIDLMLSADMRNPKNGNASHRYVISWPEVGKARRFNSCLIPFQDGPILENGRNGVTNEIVYMILIDRLQGFQSGAFACRENAIALTKTEEALMWLQKRTAARRARGVEGTNQL